MAQARSRHLTHRRWITPSLLRRKPLLCFLQSPLECSLELLGSRVMMQPLLERSFDLLGSWVVVRSPVGSGHGRAVDDELVSGHLGRQVEQLHGNPAYQSAPQGRRS